jgi:preprotein translocase subunit SecY
MGYLSMLRQGLTLTAWESFGVITFWTAGAIFTLWLGERISERGIGNGVSLMIFAGIVVGLPYQLEKLSAGLRDGAIQWYQVALLLAVFFVATWLVVYFTSAQRRIPIQHVRRNVGTRVVGGKVSYLPLSLLMAGVIPIIFASSIISMPQQFATMFGRGKDQGFFLNTFADWISPAPQGLVIAGLNIKINPLGCLIYCLIILFFSYFWTSVQYNVGDMADNLKKSGSIIPGLRPGKQTKDFLDVVISRVTLVGAVFISVIALMQFIVPQITGIGYDYGVGFVGGTSLLILVSVALETMRQIEANLLMKQYD